MQIQEVHGWVAEAGEVALHFFNGVEGRLKPDRSVVTAADEEIEHLLRQRIGARYPDHDILGEEQGGASTEGDYLWAIDPIDGTSSFVQGLPIWGISVGLLYRQQPVLGCFLMPLINEWYEVGMEGPATFNGQPMKVTSGDLLDTEAWLGVPSNVHRRYDIDFPGKVRSLGSVAAYLCYVARGTATGAIMGRPHLWDIAAGLAILRRAGGNMYGLLSGEPLTLESMVSGEPPTEIMVAGSPPAATMLRERVRIRPRPRA